MILSFINLPIVTKVTLAPNSINYLTSKIIYMKKNIGSADRIIRILLAALAAFLYFTNVVTGTLGIVILVVGGILLLTSLAGTCPLYRLVGLNTCPAKK